MDYYDNINKGNYIGIRDSVETWGLPEDAYTVLKHAIIHGRNNIVTYLVEVGCPINSTDTPTANTPLHISINKENYEIVKLLLDKGALIETTNRSDETSLDAALRKRNNDIIDLVVDKIFQQAVGPKFYVLNAIHAACMSGDEMKVVSLLKENPIAFADEHIYKHPEYNGHCTEKNFKLNGFTALHIAIELDQSNLIRILMRAGANLKARTSMGFTALHLAVDRANLRLVDFILAENKTLQQEIRLKEEKENKDELRKIRDLNAEKEPGFFNRDILDAYDAVGHNPLHHAIMKGYDEIVHFLLRQGANLFSRDTQGSTILHVAMKTGDVRILKMVLDIIDNHNEDIRLRRKFPRLSANDIHRKSGQFDINSKDHSGNTALHLAVDSPTLAEILVNIGADVGLKNNQGLTPLHLASRKNEKWVFNLLIDTDRSCFKNINPADEHNFSHFHAACMRDNPEKVGAFLDNGVDINSTLSATSIDRPGYTALHLAVEARSEKVIQLLINQGANVDAIDTIGRTPLYLATQQRNEDMMELLLENNANPNILSSTRVSLLHICVARNFKEGIKILVNNGADVDLKDDRGVSAVQSALQNYWICSDIMEMLLLKTQNLHSRDDVGRTLLHKSVEEMKYNHVKLLLKRGAEVNAIGGENWLTPLHVAARIRYINLVTLLLENGADTDARSKTGGTPLHEFAAKGNSGEMLDKRQASISTKIVQLIVKFRGKLGARDFVGSTPMHLAVENNNPNALYALLQNGADINIRDKWGNTPLTISTPDQENIIFLLRNHIYKMKTLGFFLSDQNNNRYNTIKDIKDPEDPEALAQHPGQDAISELEKMKTIVLDEDCTLYDILVMDNIENYVENVTLRSIMATIDDAFPLYAFAVRSRVTRCYLQIARFHTMAFLIRRGLPDLCSQMIIDFLGNENLDEFYEVALEEYNESQRSN